MKTFFKILLGIIGAIYLALIIVVTVCLLCYNDYKVTEINNHSLVIIEDKTDMYSPGDLVVFQGINNKDVNVNDEIFFYEVTNGIPSINFGKVTQIVSINNNESTYQINNNHEISSKSVIGKTATAKIYPKLGKYLAILESKFGFIILVILPTLVLFLYEIYRFIIELKTPAEDE